MINLILEMIIKVNYSWKYGFECNWISKDLQQVKNHYKKKKLLIAVRSTNFSFPAHLGSLYQGQKCDTFVPLKKGLLHLSSQ